MDSSIIADASGTTQQLHEGVASISKQVSKMEKFLNNLAALQQKTMEKLQSVQTQNTKMTLRYNGFREDYRRLIIEEVEMRTARNKDQFISRDQLEGVRNTIREIGENHQKKVDCQMYNSDTEKSKIERLQTDTKLREELQKVRIYCETNVNSLRKADIEMNSWIQSFRQDIMKRVDTAKTKVELQLKQIQEPLNKLSAQFDTNTIRVNQIFFILDKQLKRKNQWNQENFIQLQRKIFEGNKSLHDELELHLSSVNTKLESFGAKDDFRFEEQLKQFSNIKVQMTTNEESLNKIQEQMQIASNTFESQLQSVRDQYNTDHQQILCEINQLKQKLDKTNQLDKPDKNKDEKMIQGKRKNSISGGQSPRKNSNVGFDSPRFNESDNSPRKRSGTYDESQNQFADKMQRVMDGGATTPLPGGMSRQSIILTKEHENTLLSLQTSHSNLRVRMNDLEMSLSIVREMIESKVNQSQILKLQQIKCNKHAFKDLVVKLELFKSFIERLLPNCQGLKQLIFDDSGLLANTLTRLTALKTRHQTRADESSKSKQKDKQVSWEIPSEKKTPLSSKLPVMLNKSRKRYLTFFDRSMSHTVHQARPMQLK